MSTGRVVTFGEIMGRLAMPGFKRFRQAMPGPLDLTFAGAEATVAAAIASFGGTSAFVTALPRHEIADACVDNLARFGVDTGHILRTARGRLGLFFLETGANQRPTQVIYDREGSAVALTPPEAYDWDAIFAGASWFHITGITPALSANAAEVTRTALREASARGLRISLDVNFRGKLWNWAPPLPPRDLAARTLMELMPHVTVFLGGLEDAALLGVAPEASAPDPHESVARQLAARHPRLTHIAMSLREGAAAQHSRWGGMLYDVSCETTWRAPLDGDGAFRPHEISSIVDRLGAGDAFAAGLIHALTTPELKDPRRAIAFAVAAGCLAHSIDGDFVQFSRAEVELLVAGDGLGRVKR